MRRKLVVLSVISAVVGGIFTLGILALDSDQVTNDDIVKMAKAQLSPSIIISTIQAAKSFKFKLAANDLIALKAAGVSNSVIEAMFDKSSPAAREPVPTPIPQPPIPKETEIAKPTGTKPLDRSTALQLAQGLAERVTGSIPPIDPGGPIRASYQELVNAGLLICGPIGVIGQRECRVANTANGFNDDHGPHSLAGKMVPVRIDGITETAPNSATAIVQLSFQPTPFYAQHKAVLDGLWGFTPRAERTVNVNFQRFDDGWRALQ